MSHLQLEYKFKHLPSEYMALRFRRVMFKCTNGRKILLKESKYAVNKNKIMLVLRNDIMMLLVL
jgi:hypothetical protein